MSIDEHLSSLVNFMPLETLKERLSVPLALLVEPVQAVFGSTIVGGDGVSLAGILLITHQYVCDVRLSKPTDFDIVRRKTVKNLRLSIWDHEVKKDETVLETFQIGKLELVHELSSSFTTLISYAGKERDVWLKSVLEIFSLDKMMAES
jgi:hypothetical protein